MARANAMMTLEVLAFRSLRVQNDEVNEVQFICSAWIVGGFAFPLREWEDVTRQCSLSADECCEFHEHGKGLLF